LTHIWVASIPISGVGATCGLGAQEVIKTMIKERINELLLKYFSSFYKNR